MRIRQASSDQYTDQRVVEHAAWSPAQLIALVIGLVSVVIGGIALARTGFNFSPEHYVTVAGLGQTAVMALIEIGFGVLALGVGSTPGADRGGMVFLGIIALAGGIIVGVQHASFYRTLGTTADNGWTYAIAGAILLVAGMASPVFGAQRTVASAAVRRDDVV